MVEASAVRLGVLEHDLCNGMHCQSAIFQELDKVEFQRRRISHFNITINIHVSLRKPLSDGGTTLSILIEAHD